MIFRKICSIEIISHQQVSGHFKITHFENFLVLINLCRTVIKSKLTQLPVFNSKRRRSSRFFGIPTTERELTEEFKHKLKESLKLPDDVTDEEILGLSAISETANYSTIPPANKDDIDLESFWEMKTPPIVAMLVLMLIMVKRY